LFLLHHLRHFRYALICLLLVLVLEMMIFVFILWIELFWIINLHSLIEWLILYLFSFLKPIIITHILFRSLVWSFRLLSVLLNSRFVLIRVFLFKVKHFMMLITDILIRVHAKLVSLSHKSLWVLVAHNF